MSTELRDYVYKLNNNLQAIGIKTGEITRVDINSRATKRMGMCEKTKEGYRIEVSKFILSDRKELTDTIYHELLHTVKGCMNHGKKWNSLANKVNKTYNVNVTRTVVANQELKQEQIKRAKYKAVCQKCGKEIYRQRISNFIKNPARYSCVVCRGKFKVEKI